MERQSMAGKSPDELRAAEVSALDAAESYLHVIEKLNPGLNAFISTTRELAISDAGALDAAKDQGDDPGPLAGFVMGIKDNVDVGGVPTTVGSAAFRDSIPRADAEVVRRLRAAGALIVGKTNLHELVYGTTTKNIHFGFCRNPWGLDRVPGGSSGGSGAALAAGMCNGAIGTDTGGSVRIPAALTGVTGLRPTVGAVSVRGSFPISVSYDTVGPMAKSVEDVARLYAVIAGFDPLDEWSVNMPALADVTTELKRGVEGLRIGVPRSYFFEENEPEVEARVREALEVFAKLGSAVVEVSLPDVGSANHAMVVIREADSYALHKSTLEAKREFIQPDLAERIELGARYSGKEFADAIATARRWQRDMRAIFDEVDVIVTPTSPIVAPSIEGADEWASTAALTQNTFAWSVLGGPGLSVPCGFGSSGLPVGMQIAAPPWADALALRVGYAYQTETDWHRRQAATSEDTVGATT